MRSEASLSVIVGELEHDNLLPAICFRTSRSQCDADIRHAERSKSLKLVSREQQRIIAAIKEIVRKYDMEEDLILRHPHYDALVQAGVGAHHAGQLLIWRLLLEELMVSGLLTVLVATGTVAAGVDFPARTVIVTAHSRRGSEGYNNYSASEFQQMSGRAGRRGKDTVGFCIVTPSRFCDARQVLKIAARPPEPLTSAYYPSPSTVLNLLKYRNVDDLIYTVEKCLASFVDRRSAALLDSEALEIEESLVLANNSTENNKDRNRSERLQKLAKRARRLRKMSEELRSKQVTLLNRAFIGLEELGYMNNQQLSDKGSWASNICTNLVLEMGEIIESGMLDNATPEHLVCTLAAIAGDGHRKYLESNTPPISAQDIEKLEEIVRRVRSKDIPGVSSDTSVIPNAAYTALSWMHADNWQAFRGLLALVGVQEGDAARLITQTGEHLNQLTRLIETHPKIARIAEIARSRIMRPPLSEGLESE